ncbi:hypothetical protein KSP39_PZI016248 [Platanthera zijinensis]|uniref:Uncharacterized protein n=1 Tax=Platanthera zijinensis TaxID=2320716 RepID=A0AAP0B6G4_9ASPA
MIKRLDRVLLPHKQTIEKKKKKAVRVTEGITDSSSSKNNEKETYDTQLTESSEESRKDMCAHVLISSEPVIRTQFGGSQSDAILAEALEIWIGQVVENIYANIKWETSQMVTDMEGETSHMAVLIEGEQYGDKRGDQDDDKVGAQWTEPSTTSKIPTFSPTADQIAKARVNSFAEEEEEIRLSKKKLHLPNTLPLSTSPHEIKSENFDPLYKCILHTKLPKKSITINGECFAPLSLHLFLKSHLTSFQQPTGSTLIYAQSFKNTGQRKKFVIHECVF